MIEAGERLSLPQVDVLGASIAQRTAEALLAAGVRAVGVISAEPQATFMHAVTGSIRYVKSSPEELWNDARKVCAALADNGADTVLMIRLNRYCEIDWKRFFTLHREGTARLTRAWVGASEPLDIFAVDAKFHRDADFLFQNELAHARLTAGRYQVSDAEYVHELRTANDLREIAWDGLNLRCAMRPAGREVRPGVWRAEGSRIDAGVRLVAPVYIGRRARVRRGAVITRSSALEHHSSVDCGTVVENTTVLPYATVGAGLDLSRTVVGNHQVMDLKRNVTVDIYDRTLVDEAAHNAGIRLASKAMSLVTYLPMQFWRGLTERHPLPDLPVGAICTDLKSVEKKPAAPALGPEFVLERYGNQ